MKIPFDKIPGFNKLPPVLRNNPKFSFRGYFLSSHCFGVFDVCRKQGNPQDSERA